MWKLHTFFTYSLRYFFLNFIQISQKFLPNSLIDTYSALVQVIAVCQTGDKLMELVLEYIELELELGTTVFAQNNCHTNLIYESNLMFIN